MAPNMLDRFDKEQAPRAMPSLADSPGQANGLAQGQNPADAPMPAQQSALTRLLVRRWLILLFLAIILALCAFYRLPWDAAALAIAAFCLGAAAIPRSGLPAFYRPAAVDQDKATQPLRVGSMLIEALPEPAILLSRDGTVLSFNCEARDLFGGLKAGSHLSSGTRNPMVLGAVANCSPEKPPQTVEFSDRVPVERYMAATVSFLHPWGGSGPSMLLVLRDLTEQRRLDQLRADFIANASHEIKTPLASLVGFIETLQGAARHDEAARDRFLGIMAKQAARMARLIDNLMSLSRVEMRAHLKPQDYVMAGDLLRQACHALEPMAAEAEIKVTVQAERDDAAVLGDHDELMQVFINLIHNAIKYGRRAGSVQVTLRRVKNGPVPMIEIAVEDDGPGIPSQHLPRLTERFYRVPGTSAMEKGGTGLGLAIVKHVVNRHRGEFRIASEEGRGAKFTVLLAELPAESEQ